MSKLTEDNYGNRLTEEEAGKVVATWTSRGITFNRHQAGSVKAYEAGEEVKCKPMLRIVAGWFHLDEDSDKENTRTFGKRMIDDLNAMKAA